MQQKGTRSPDGKEFSWVHTLQVLGCFLEGTGSTEAQVSGRLPQGRKMFNKLRPFFVLRADSSRRTHWWILLHGRDQRVWGSGCWTPSLKVQQLVFIQENRRSRCIMGGRKESAIEWVVWLQETKRAAHSLRCESWAFRLCGTGRRYMVGQDTWLGCGCRYPKKNWVRGFESTLVKDCALGRDSREKGENQIRGFISEAVRFWSRPRLAKLKGKITPPAPFLDVGLI